MESIDLTKPKHWDKVEVDEPEKVVMVSVAHKDLIRARVALGKAIMSEESKYNPSESLLRAYRDGLKAIVG